MEKVYELAKKLKALAERGIDGEKFNAQAALDRLCKKHNISIADLENIEVANHYFKVNPAYQKLFTQVVSTVLGNTFEQYSQRGKADSRILKCTNCESIEIDAKFEFYKNAYEKQLDIFHKAFIYKNDLYPNDTVFGEDESSTAPPDIAEIRKVVEMANGIPKVNFFKQLNRS